REKVKLALTWQFPLRSPLPSTRLKWCPIPIQPLTGSYQLVLSLRALVESASDLRVLFMASGGSDRDAEDALSKFLQMGTVAEYHNESNPTTLGEAFSLSLATEARFTNLQLWELLRSNPTTFGETFFKARITEDRFEDERFTTTIVKANDLNTGVHVQDLELETKVLVDGKQDDVKVVKVVGVTGHQNSNEPNVLKCNGVIGVGVNKNNKRDDKEVQYSVYALHVLIPILKRLNDRYIKKKKIEAVIQRRLWDPVIKSVFQDNTLRARKKNFNPSLLCSSKTDDSKERVGNNVELRNLNVSWKDGVECEEIELMVSEMGDNSKCVRVLDDFCDDKVCYNAGKDGNREEEDCNIEEIESHGVTDVTGGWIGGGELCKDGKGKQIKISEVITNSFRLKVLGEICKEDAEVKGIQSKNSKEDDKNKKRLSIYNDIGEGGDESKGSEYLSFEEKYDGWFENQIEAPKVSGYNLDKLKMDNGYVMCGNRGMSKVTWKPLVKMRMNGGIMGENSRDADYVVIGINDFIFSENEKGRKHVFKDKAWYYTDKHDEDMMESRVGIDGNIEDKLGIKEKGKDKDMESSGLMHNRAMSYDDGTNVSLSRNGNSICVGMDDELVQECLSCMQMEADKPLVEKFKKSVEKNENEGEAVEFIICLATFKSEENLVKSVWKKPRSVVQLCTFPWNTYDLDQFEETVHEFSLVNVCWLLRSTQILARKYAKESGVSIAYWKFDIGKWPKRKKTRVMFDIWKWPNRIKKDVLFGI
ncbi:hypothetical protein Tco_0390714, partial [Tanacetum coccineum]